MQDSPVLVCAGLNCTGSLCCTKACRLMRICTWMCDMTGCSMLCCTELACTWTPMSMWTCTLTACSVRGCNAWECGTLVCTANCACTTTPVRSSCTSSLQWLCLCLPSTHSAQEEGRWKSKGTHQSSQKAVSFASFFVFRILLVSSSRSSC